MIGLLGRGPPTFRSRISALHVNGQIVKSNYGPAASVTASSGKVFERGAPAVQELRRGPIQLLTIPDTWAQWAVAGYRPGCTSPVLLIPVLPKVRHSGRVGVMADRAEFSASGLHDGWRSGQRTGLARCSALSRPVQRGRPPRCLPPRRTRRCRRCRPKRPPPRAVAGRQSPGRARHRARGPGFHPRPRWPRR